METRNQSNIAERDSRKAITFGLVFTVALVAVALIIAGLASYPGSKLVYTVFSIMFWLMLLSAFTGRTHYGYLFFVTMLWLGFWVKITAHLLLDYPYIEPTGMFSGSADEWDKVLWVAVVASMGVMLGRLAVVLLGRRYNGSVRTDQLMVPPWYSAARSWMWPLAVLVIAGINVLNVYYGIFQIGLTPQTILAWPLNALISWQVSIGNALCLAVLVWWEVSLRRGIFAQVFVMLFEAFVSTVSLLSRGVFIFHSLPQLFALFKNRELMIGLTKARVAVLVLLFAIMFAMSIAAVSTLRAYLYPHAGGFTTENQKMLTRLEVVTGGLARVDRLIASGENHEQHRLDLIAEKARLEMELSKGGSAGGAIGESKNAEVPVNAGATDSVTAELLSSKDQAVGKLFVDLDKRLLGLIVDRWIGLEGVMAVSAYPGKSNSLLREALTEKRDNDSYTIYQDISESHYRWVDTGTWQFASLPGVVGFLFFSGSLWIVLMGVGVLTLFLQLAEDSIFALTSNPLLCSLLGLTMANSLAQFGVAPRQEIPFYSMIIAFLICVCIIQSVKFSDLINKMRSLNR